MAIRGAAIAGLAWAATVFVLWRGGEWVNGRFVHHISVRSLATGGLLGSTMRPAIHRFLAAIGNQTVFTFERLASILGRVLSWTSLPLFCFKIMFLIIFIYALGGFLIQTAPESVPRALKLKLDIASVVWPIFSAALYSFLLFLIMLTFMAYAKIEIRLLIISIIGRKCTIASYHKFTSTTRRHL